MSMLFLAIASLIAIPAMVNASGARAWGMVAAGQAIGAIAAVVVSYGWGLSGPAIIAKASPGERAREYVESALARLVLYFPAAALAVAAAWAMGGELAVFSAIGALSTASIGLTANWYFVGTGSPYQLLACETMPRVLGTLTGILFMHSGASAAVGVAGQLVGMLVAFVVSSIWILWPRKSVPRPSSPRRSLSLVLGRQQNGVISTVLSVLYVSAPILIVTALVPAVQPLYAVVEKVQRQINVGLGTFVTVLQGWVPRARASQLVSRIRSCLLICAAMGAVVAMAIFLAGPVLVGWLGNNQIHPSPAVFLLLALVTALALVESVLSKACLAAVDRLAVVARATAVASVIGLAGVAVLVPFWGAAGALLGVALGLAVRVCMELVGLRRAVRDHDGACAELARDTTPL